MLPLSIQATGAFFAPVVAQAAEEAVPQEKSEAPEADPQPPAPKEAPAPEAAAREAAAPETGAKEAAAKEAAAKASLEKARRAALARRAASLKPLKVIHTRATWYGPGFHGRRTANGERFNQNAMTLASRHLPFGTRVRVVNMKNGTAAVARVNDRGPFGHRGYTADLSKGLARKIGMAGSGPVRLEILPRGSK